MRKQLSIAISALILVGFSNQVLAVDWPALQGLEGQKKEKALKLWGFLQPDYSRTKGTTLGAGAVGRADSIFQSNRTG